MQNNHCYFWFRRDLRIEDNCGLWHALQSGKKVIPVFIFDTEILNRLENKSDRRVAFIHERICALREQFQKFGSDIEVQYAEPLQAWKQIFDLHGASDIYTNNDYEPYAIKRDNSIQDLVQSLGYQLFSFKDQVVLEKNDVLKDDGKPYTVYTPYSRKWNQLVTDTHFTMWKSEDALAALYPFRAKSIPDLTSMGFANIASNIAPPDLSTSLLSNYAETRDIPSLQGTSRVSVHLRFGTISVRKLYQLGTKHSMKWTNELIWREFYMQILWHFPQMVNHAFKPAYDRIQWRNNETEFAAWCEGRTGYPIVDAGMKELLSTGFMHNRIRMVVASFLTKHLLIDWRWGEAFFAEKLLDFELSSNNGGWQWAAGCGVDAAPYFRIFNPYLQTKKFDPQLTYIQKWLPEKNSLEYPAPIVDHEFARKRCLDVYASALKTEAR